MAGVAKISVSMEDGLYRRIRAKAGGQGVSRWLADAADERLRREALLAVAGEIAQETGGPFSDRELGDAREWLRSSSTPAR
jgi:hypothetical protein